MAISDECGTVAPILTSPIMTFPHGGLSTWKPPPADYGGNFSVGASWDVADPDTIGIVAPLTIKDWPAQRGGWERVRLPMARLSQPLDRHGFHLSSHTRKRSLSTQHMRRFVLAC